MATAIATHIAYVAAVGSMDDAIGRTGRSVVCHSRA